MAGYSILGDNSLYTSGWDNGLTPTTNFNSGYSNIVNNGGLGTVTASFGNSLGNLGSNSGLQTPVFNYNNALSSIGSGISGKVTSPMSKLTTPFKALNANTDPSNILGGSKVKAAMKATNGTNGSNTGFFNSDGFGNILGAIGTGLNGLAGIGAYLNGKEQLKLARQAMAQQQNNFNESFNAAFKQYNRGLTDLLSSRANFQTGDSHAYDDEIAANSVERGHTGAADSSYLNYKRSANV